ncbi:MAG: outer membrane lipoprotein carrier protein LolA [Desulfuromonadales bacterium]|jgi:outer membrane lipoprotein carrier protein|nr:outer membrane lipoprotein carrier protein LolA [Desulfuromonadales bacterium]
MIRPIAILLLLACCVATNVAAQDFSLSDTLQTLESPFKAGAQENSGGRIHDFQAEFRQASHIASIDRTQRGEGSVRFKFLPDQAAADGIAMFRWGYREPTVQEIVSDGRTLWFYLPENRQVIESDLSRLQEQQGQNPVTFLSGLANLSRDFSVEWAAPDHDAAGNPAMLLKPRLSSQYIDRLEVVVSRRAVEEYTRTGRAGTLFPILSTAVYDPGGNRTEIYFDKVQVNQYPSAELFRFQPPEGVEVVSPSEQGLGY